MLSLIRIAPRVAVGFCRRFARQPSEAILLCRLAWWVAVLSIAARCLSLPRALRIVAPQLKSGAAVSTEEQERLAGSLDLVLSTNVLVFRPICWKRAAVLHRFLALRGINTRVCFGVRPGVQDKVLGHAWLELDGKPILEKEPPDYVVTYSFPSNDNFKESDIVFSPN